MTDKIPAKIGRPRGAKNKVDHTPVLLREEPVLGPEKPEKRSAGRPPRGVLVHKIDFKKPMVKVDDLREMINIYVGEEGYARHAKKFSKYQRRRIEEDLFYLIWRVLKREDIAHPFLYARVREVEANPNGYIDLWSRELYKSTIITYALTIQDIIKDPEITVAIFSFKKSIAEAFLAQIKYELESNETLLALYPNILWQNTNESPSWSLQNGITVKRKTNPKERTIEACGIIDGQPVSKHYKLMVYDDVVTAESVTTVDQIKKVLERFELSLNLGAQDGVIRMIGTRYHFKDMYGTIIDRGLFKPRIYAATENGLPDGNPVYHTRDYLNRKRQGMSNYTFACQMLQNPAADSVMGFDKEMLRYYDRPDYISGFNTYILVDPASEKGKRNDYTVMLVIGLAADSNYYLLDAVRDRLNLQEKADALIDLHRKYRPLAVGYEKYGMQGDVDGIELIQNINNYRFKITPLAGNTSKGDRIRRLVPYFANNLIYLPRHLMKNTKAGELEDLIEYFVEFEYVPFPLGGKDDMLDCLSRICDENFPMRAPMLGDVVQVDRSMKYPATKLLERKTYDRVNIMKGRALSY
jgi:predicted phage terminase large subunit-like protein